MRAPGPSPAAYHQPLEFVPSPRSSVSSSSNTPPSSASPAHATIPLPPPSSFRRDFGINPFGGTSTAVTSPLLGSSPKLPTTGECSLPAVRG